jgi:hypothetical protein
MAKRIGVFLGVVLWAVGSLAQSSASYQLTESVLNAGGNPSPVLTSTGYQVTLDAVGDPVSGANLSSASYSSDAGFAALFHPPGEVLDLRFTDSTHLAWDPEPSVGSYNLYRGLVSGLSGGYGACLSSGLTGESVVDASIPSAGQCFFYLVNAENRIAEEGTLGRTSSGAERANPGPCP